MSIDIALVRPWSRSAVPSDALVEDSLGIGYLTSTLRSKNITVAVVDAFTMGFNDDEVVSCLLNLSPRIAALSLHSFADYKHLVNISSNLRSLHPECYQVVGGEHATFLAKEVLTKIPSTDAVVMGEGELTLVKIAESVLQNKRPVKITGAMIRDSDNNFQDGGFSEAIADLDSVPWPHKDTIEMAIKLNKPAALSMLTGRGCYHKCTFCTAFTYLRLGGGNVWRRRNPKDVVDELQWLMETYHNKPNIHPMIQFQDVIFLGTPKNSIKWTENFLKELEQRKLVVPYYFMSRADAIIANQHLLPRLAASGLASVEIGIETGVDRILESYNKRNSRERTIQAIDLLRKHHVCYDASGFIMFDPNVLLEELKDNAKFLCILGHATWDRYVTRLQVFPGTEIRQQLIKEGLFNSDHELDDVYSYKFRDSRVQELLNHVWMYDEIIHQLNNFIREGRAEIANQCRKGYEEPKKLAEITRRSQELYRDHFLALIDLIEQGTIKEKAESQITNFVASAKVMVNEFQHIFASNIANNKNAQEEYISQLQIFNKALSHFQKQIENTSVKKIEITKDGSIFHLEPFNIKMITDGSNGSALFDIVNFGKYEPLDSDILLQMLKNDFVVFDIGAHIGWYTVNFFKSQEKIQIYSFEPIPTTFNCLIQNLKLNDIPNSFAFNYGFSENNQEDFLYYIKDCSALASIKNITESVATDQISCKLRRMDDVVHELKINRLDLIKCDIEGAELLAFKGACHTLERFKPIIYTELYEPWCTKFGYQAMDVRNLLAGFGYECYTASPNGLIEIQKVIDTNYKHNFFFLHKENHKDILASMT